MTTIRSNPFPQTPLHTPPGGQRQGGLNLSAQRAFFAAAMGQAQAPAAPSDPAASHAAAPTASAVSAPAAAPERILRPGSILDIRV